MPLTGDDIPAFTEMMNPTLQALRNAGGTATIDRINAEVAQTLSLTDKQLKVLRYPNDGGRTIVEERMSWARTYLQKAGILKNPKRGTWSLTACGRVVIVVDPAEVRLLVKELED